MFTAAQVAAGGTPTATVERTGIGSPQGLAFDNAGNLWVAAHDDAAVVRIDAGHLAASGDAATISRSWRRTTMSSVTSTLRSPISLAFDAAGNLWVNYDGTIASIPVADQTGTGSKTITPAS